MRPAAVIAAAAAVAIAATASDFDGLTSAEIIHKINSQYRPRQIVAPAELFPILYGNSPVDPFTGHRTEPGEWRTIHVVPPTFWSEQNRAVAEDLYNLVAVSKETMAQFQRLHITPGTPLKLAADYGLWYYGDAFLLGRGVGVFMPPKEIRGDLARAMMYMAVVYPEDFRPAEAVATLSDGLVPALTEFGARMLLPLHLSDPVDAAEYDRMQAIAALQGADNPFVTHPDLAEYIWGDRRDQKYGETATAQPVQPLKATYSRATDRLIHFYTPLVGDLDAQWQLDGKPVDSTIPLEQLSDGKHEVTYTSSTSQGRLIIIVMP